MGETHLGELAALATAVCWTVTAMAFESAGRRVGSLSVNLIRLLMGFFFLTLYCAVVRGHALPTDATVESWIWLAASGVVGFTIGDLCLFRAFVVIGSRLSMLLMAMVPPITAITGYGLLGETMTQWDLLGMALTVGGVAWVVLERNEANGRPSRVPLSGVLLGLGGAVGQSLGLVLSKRGMMGYDAFAATQIRILAGIAGFVVLFSLIGWWRRFGVALGDRQAMARTGLGAFFGPFLGVSLSLVAVVHTQAGVAATLMSLVPVMIIPPAIMLFKEQVSSRAVLGSLLAVGGSALLFL